MRALRYWISTALRVIWVVLVRVLAWYPVASLVWGVTFRVLEGPLAGTLIGDLITWWLDIYVVTPRFSIRNVTTIEITLRVIYAIPFVLRRISSAYWLIESRALRPVYSFLFAFWKRIRESMIILSKRVGQPTLNLLALLIDAWRRGLLGRRRL